MNFDICEIALPGADKIDPSWVGQQADDLERECATETLGAPDFHDGFASWPHFYRNQVDHVSVNLVAVTGVAVDALPRGRFGLPELSWDASVEQTPPGQVLATAGASASLQDNPMLGNWWITVGIPHRGQGVGTALLQEIERILTSDWGRTSLQTWRDHETPTEGGERIVPPTNVGAIGRDGGARFLLRHGYALEQCERHSICPLPVDVGTLDRLEAEARAKAAGYVLRQYTDRAPDDLVEAICEMLEHFTEQAPSAGLDWEKESWTVERLRRGEERRIATGRRAFCTVAIHEETGKVAAMTEICTSSNHAEVAFQQVTIVDADHRGHRLGMLVKVANLRWFQTEEPGRRRIHTWNAGENQWMLAINHALGFADKLTEGAWQKRAAKV